MRHLPLIMSLPMILTACASSIGMQTDVRITAIPPLQYRGDTTATIEFLAPGKLETRCLAKGAWPLNLPLPAAAACSDIGASPEGSPPVISVPNPCFVVAGGPYARLLCHELGHANGWAANHPKDGSPIPPSDIPPPASNSPKAQAFTRACGEGNGIRC